MSAYACGSPAPPISPVTVLICPNCRLSSAQSVKAERFYCRHCGNAWVPSQIGLRLAGKRGQG